MDQPDESILLAGVAEATAELLRQSGYSIVEVRTESEALDRLRSNGINLIIAAGDAAFPLLTSVKHLGPAIGPRMIVLAADAAGKIQALDQRADDALADPIDPAELLARVRSQLRGHRAESSMRNQTRLAEE